ncbi:fatty acid synthase Fas [Mycobacterium tuberculosis CAS/NITR204]|uniref:Fatty acid synthase Fas n=1 Tax=Mycobacterium tuberculosis CAS/NITR204 TaxID=1310114 RepID=R4MKJ0_MYCTX|nr:fatty acid synthase Fas [Mycobacterium tuberculosis CAS/NITR204]
MVGQLPTVPAQLTVTATAANATDTDMGRVVPVSVVVTGADGAVIATLEERFAILGRTGSAELATPAPSAGTPPTPRAVAAATSRSPRRSTCARSRWCPATTSPIHTDRAAALLAGL